MRSTSRLEKLSSPVLPTITRTVSCGLTDPSRLVCRYSVRRPIPCHLITQHSPDYGTHYPCLHSPFGEPVLVFSCSLDEVNVHLWILYPTYSTKASKAIVPVLSTRNVRATDTLASMPTTQRCTLPNGPQLTGPWR